MECEKKKHKSKKAALKHVRKRGTQLSKIHDRSRAYFCDVCKYWHITTTKYIKVKK